MEVLFALLIGITAGLSFGAGAFVYHFLDNRAHRKHVTSLITAEDHRNEAARIIHRSVKSGDLRYASYLRSLALAHYMQADLLENGPYRLTLVEECDTVDA